MSECIFFPKGKNVKNCVSTLIVSQVLETIKQLHIRLTNLLSNATNKLVFLADFQSRNEFYFKNLFSENNYFLVIEILLYIIIQFLAGPVLVL